MYEDDDIIVVDKPAGILCLPSEDGVPSIAETVFEYIQQNSSGTVVSNGTQRMMTTPSSIVNFDPIDSRTTKGNSSTGDLDGTTLQQRVHAMDQMVVHRLGYDTAGLLVLAKTVPAMRGLHTLFRMRPTISTIVATSNSNDTDTTSSHSSNNNSSSSSNMDNNNSRYDNDGVTVTPSNDIDGRMRTTHVDSCDVTKRHMNDLGIVRQYEVLVAGHLNRTTPTAATTTMAPLQVPQGGWINLPLMRCYEYPPYMRVSTYEQQKYLLSLDMNVVGKKLLEAPKQSLTYYEIVAYEYWKQNTSLPITRLTLTSMTGRTHQLNVHCTLLSSFVCCSSYFVCVGVHLFTYKKITTHSLLSIY
jgi:23S rRNA-/tRNA-specific pseudouridylate synthase